MTGPHRDRQHRIAELITAKGNALSSGLDGRQICVTWDVASWDSEAKATSSALCSFGRSKEELIRRPDDACRLRVSTVRGARLPLRLARFAATRTLVSAEAHAKQYPQAGWPQEMRNFFMRYAVVIEDAGANFSAYVPDLPGCVATGSTVAETEQAIREAIALHLEGLREDGSPIPPASSQVEYVEVAA